MLKKLIFLSILIVLFSKVSYAAPVYGTHMPKEHHWAWGAEGNFVRDRNLDNDEGAVKGNRYFLTGSYGVFKWLSFDGKIGIGNVRWDRNKGEDNLAYSANFAGAYGFRIKGYENKKMGIKSVAGFQHISVHPDPKNQGGDKHEVIIDDWQGSILISKDIGKLVPYFGGMYGTVDLIKRINEHDRKRIKAEKHYGVVVGMDWWISKDIKVNMEGDFLDGEEFTVGISRDF